MKKMFFLGIAASVLCLALFSSCCETYFKKSPLTKDKAVKKNKKVAHMTPEGLKYEILKEGTKSTKVAHGGDKVTVHYTGWIDDKGQPGKKIDSSLDRDQPFAFTLDKKQVIVGFNEGIKDMKIGEKRRLNIPSNMAYGKAQVGNVIPADSNLIFDIELINIA